MIAELDPKHIGTETEKNQVNIISAFIASEDHLAHASAGVLLRLVLRLSSKRKGG